MLKFSFSKKVVGCAAGGNVIDVSELRRDGVRRSARKKIIVRNWRVQMAFLAACLCIPLLSFLFVNHGLDPFYDSLEQIQDLSSLVSLNAMTGLSMTTRLIGIRNRMETLVRSINVTEYCPNYGTNSHYSDYMLLSFDEIQQNIELGMSQIKQFVDSNAEEIALGLSRLTNVNH